MENEQVVPDEGAEGTVPPVVDETSAKVPEPTEEKPLTRAEIQEMLDTKEKHWQSISERQRKALSSEAKEYRKRAEFAESRTNAYNEVMARDPKMAAQMRAAETSAQAQAHRVREQSDRAERDKESFYDTMGGIVEDFGVDPTDKRVDWAKDASTPSEANKRILASISSIKKEDAEKAEDQMSQKLKDFEADFRKKYNLDSVDNTESSGSVSSDTDFLTKYGEGELPYTKANVDRANKLINE